MAILDVLQSYELQFLISYLKDQRNLPDSLVDITSKLEFALTLYPDPYVCIFVPQAEKF